MKRINWINESVLNFMLENLDSYDLLESFKASLEYSLDENSRTGPFVEEITLWEESFVFGLTNTFFRGNLNELLDTLYEYCQENIKSLPVFDRICTLHYNFEQLSNFEEFQRIYYDFLDATGERRTIKENRILFKEIATSKVVDGFAKKLRATLNAPEDFDIIINYLKNIVRSADSEEGLISDDSAIQKKGERLETDEQLYNLLRSACNSKDVPNPKKAFKLIWNNRKRIDAVIENAIKVGNIRAAGKQFDANGFWEEVKIINRTKN